MRLAVLAAVLAMSAATALQSAAAGRRQTTAPNGEDYAYTILSAPRSGDERAFRRTYQTYAQDRSNRLFDALAAVLGGSAPALNFVSADSPLVSNHLSANIRDNPGGPLGTINVDPYAASQFIVDDATNHSGWTNQFPHEMMHTRQTPQVLSSVPDREGGAQAFADLVTAAATKKAAIPYAEGNYDGAYAAFVKQAQARGNDWLLGGQMGRPPAVWP